MISLLNYIGKVIEKVVAELSQVSENFFKLHLSQIEARKKRYSIDVVALLVYKVQQKWPEKKLVIVLFMDIKRIFEHRSKILLVAQMI